MVSLKKFSTEYVPRDFKPGPNQVWGPFAVEEEGLGMTYVGRLLQVDDDEISWFSGDRQHVRSIESKSNQKALKNTDDGHIVLKDRSGFSTTIRPLVKSDGQLIFNTPTTDLVYVHYLAAMSTLPYIPPEHMELMLNAGLLVDNYVYPPLGKEDEPVTAAADSCPVATKNIGVNISNRQQAIEAAGYGPLNPKDPNVDFWRKKAERWNTTYAEARKAVCGNCSAFIRTPSMLECISSGLQENGTDSSDGWDTINAGELGYCEAFDFKCASSRTCDAWIVGGPITEEK